MTKQNNVQEQTSFSRFLVYLGKENEEGKIERTKTVGMAYLREGQGTYTLRLWTFLTDKFYLIPQKNDMKKYYIMTREPNKNPESKNKYFWNIVGNGTIEVLNGNVRLDFDLLEKAVYMSIFPEMKANFVSLASPENFLEAA